RILREFSDQTTLATLSRQNLATLSEATPTSPVESSEGGLASLQTRIQVLQLQLEQARASTDPTVVARIFDDERYRLALKNYNNFVNDMHQGEEEMRQTNASAQAGKEYFTKLMELANQRREELKTAADELFKAKENEIARLQSAWQQAASESASTVP